MSSGSTIKEGAIAKILNKILAQPNKLHDGVGYDIYIHTVNEDIPPMHLEHVECLRDYNKNVGDYVNVRASIPMGIFIKEIYANMDNLEATIVRKSLGRTDKFKYKAIILNGRENIVKPHHTKLSREELNKLEMMMLEIQCVNLYVEKLNTVTLYGVHRNISVLDTMLAEMGTAIKNSPLGGKKSSDVLISITKPDNPTIYRNLIIPPDIKVLDLPAFLQETNYGVYNGAIGTYIQHYGPKKIPYLFIFPLYDSKRFNITKKKLMVYKTATPMYDNTRTSFIVDGDIVKIIADSHSTVVDTSDLAQIDQGVTILAGNPMQLLSCNVVTSDTDVYTGSTSNNTAQQMYKPTDGSKRIKYVGNTANLYKERAHVIRNSLAVCQIRWNFPDMDLIYPGMPVAYVYEDVKYGLVTLHGNVQSTISRYSAPNKNTLGIINVTVSKVIQKDTQ